MRARSPLANLLNHSYTLQGGPRWILPAQGVEQRSSQQANTASRIPFAQASGKKAFLCLEGRPGGVHHVRFSSAPCCMIPLFDSSKPDERQRQSERLGEFSVLLSDTRDSAALALAPRGRAGVFLLRGPALSPTRGHAGACSWGRRAPGILPGPAFPLQPCAPLPAAPVGLGVAGLRPCRSLLIGALRATPWSFLPQCWVSDPAPLICRVLGVHG